MDIPDGLRYTDDHEWLRLEAEDGVVGITAYAAGELGDVVFVELPAVGTKVAKAQSFGVIESVKAAADIYSPLSGTVIAANEDLDAAPQRINEDPYAAWLFKLSVADPAELAQLLDAGAYEKIAEADKA